METPVIVGFIAGALTTIAFVPQVIRTWKLKEARDFSLAMLILFSIGIFLWMIYGFWINSMPVIIANLVTFLLVIVLLAMKVTYR